jgi:hypothetical protein
MSSSNLASNASFIARIVCHDCCYLTQGVPTKAASFKRCSWQPPFSFPSFSNSRKTGLLTISYFHCKSPAIMTCANERSKSSDDSSCAVIQEDCRHCSIINLIKESPVEFHEQHLVEPVTGQNVGKEHP